MGTSTAMRLACGLLTFVVMARLLGPDQFGLLMLWFSISTLICLLANYGFTPYLLREIGANPTQAVKVMSDVLTAKLMLSACIAIAGIGSFLFLPASIFYLFIVLLIAQLADSMTEFFNVGYRATNRYGSETQLASLSAVIQLILVSAACFWLAKPIVAAAAFMLARLFVLMITWRSQLRYFSQLSLSPWQDGWQKIKRTHAFASDFALQSLFGQIDSLVLNHFLGPASVGVYQAGMRIFNGGAQAASVLANVFLPRAAQASAEQAEFSKESTTIQQVFIACGFGFACFLTLASQPLTHYLFGSEFSALAGLLPWFGALFLVRFIASSWGIILTSAGEQLFRAKMNAYQWILVLLSAFVLVPKFKEPGWLISIIIGNVFLILTYYLKAATKMSVRISQLWQPVTALLLFAPIFAYELAYIAF